MRNPFEDGGIVDKAMPWLLLGMASVRLYGDISTYRHGGSFGWLTLVALVVALSSLYRIYYQVRERRRAPEAENLD